MALGVSVGRRDIGIPFRHRLSYMGIIPAHFRQRGGWSIEDDPFHSVAERRLRGILNAAENSMIEGAKLVGGVIMIMRGHLATFSSDIGDDELRLIATNLIKMVRRAESKMALEQYVGAELNKLCAAPNPYAAIVSEASALVKNSKSSP
jgi:hypothetical protein